MCVRKYQPSIEARLIKTHRFSTFFFQSFASVEVVIGEQMGLRNTNAFLFLCHVVNLSFVVNGDWVCVHGLLLIFLQCFCESLTAGAP